MLSPLVAKLPDSTVLPLPPLIEVPALPWVMLLLVASLTVLLLNERRMARMPPLTASS